MGAPTSASKISNPSDQRSMTSRCNPTTPFRPGPAAAQLETQPLTLQCHCQLLPVIEKKTVYSGMCLFMLM